ncbi:hypothetical protein SmJEL517_g04506 [Synchytrium microbalum]|uniref:DUF4139 domain-containing protein n=1 Tax=Synchytrium microbalum TaxID=1806994 RepID=A0A507C476_9FUNG|nr:uncharacterized protein SmJEL517_g04506 [Synchytrium microbalum]TPX32323.1 hypothetical protein SmJEL517_g04506 [Synchytrium microbalum]
MASITDSTTTGAANTVEATPNAVDIDAKKEKVSSVVVFSDRAQVTRIFTGKALLVGQNEVKIKNLPTYIDKDSIRVEGRGNATILDVVFTSKWVTKEPVSDSKEVDKLKSRIKAIDIKVKALANEKKRVDGQRKLFNDYADAVTTNKPVQANATPVTQGAPAMLEGKVVEGLVDFVASLARKWEVFDEREAEIAEEVTALEEEKYGINMNLNQMGSQSYSTQENVVEVVVLLDAEKDGDVDLTLSYIVTRASWTSLFDIRVFTDSKAMKLTYKAEIKQSTGEDWTDVSLALSTATPAVGGDPPELSPWYVSIRPKPRPMMEKKSKSMVSARRSSPNMAFGGAPAPPMVMSAAPMMASYAQAPGGGGSMSQDMLLMDEESASDMNQRTAFARESLTSTTYQIPSKATIPSDNVPHKVTVAIIDYKPTFTWTSVPKIDAKAFLKATVKNDSEYALLAGPANIFLDDSFVCKASLKSVAPQEEFESSLGIDNTIRITYKPVSKKTETSGILQRSNVTRYTQAIEIKNTKQQEITLNLVDQIPISSEEKLVVRIVKPDVTVAKPVASYVDAGNEVGVKYVEREGKFEYTLKMKPGTKQVVEFCWDVSLAVTEAIDGI